MTDQIQKLKLSKITKLHMHQKISTFGWIKNIRSSGKIGTFIDLQLGFSTIKCLSPNLLKLTPHSSINITGTVMPNLGKDNAEFEVHIEQLEVFRLAPSFPINKHSYAHNLLENGHLWLQTDERMLFLKARNELMHIIRDYYYTNQYVEVTPPTLVQTQVEGGSTLFSLKYYDEMAYLTQSSQLYLETVVPATEKAYCIMPSYRAEKSSTTRHLSEYTHVEGEIADITFEELLVEIETMLKFVLVSFKAKGFDVELYQDQFVRITYEDAIETLRKNNVKKKEEDVVVRDYEYGDDISDRDEVALIEILGNKPVFLINFPVEHKPFYCKKVSDKKTDHGISGNSSDDKKDDIEDNKDCTKQVDGSKQMDGTEQGTDDKKLEQNGIDPVAHVEKKLDGLLRQVTESVDLLWPGIGEILGGSMREDDYDKLMDGFKREDIDSSNYYWYTDLRLFGSSRHGGYGLGFERLLKALMKYESINNACLYPRFLNRCRP